MPRKLCMHYILAVVGIVLIDQITKYLVRGSMEVGDVIPVLGDFLTIRYVRNTGVAFGMMDDSGFVVTAIQIAVIVIVLIILIRNPNITKHSNMALLMVLAGGIGNLIDRIILGYVTDMISINFFPPVFNVADIFVTLGCFFLLLELLLDISKEKKQ